MAFIDDDDIPPRVFEIVAVLQIALEGVDRNDAAIEVVERVVVGRDAVAHPGQANRVQPHQRDRKAAPPLLLELGEHGLLCDDEDALATAPLNQLGGQHAGFQRLAQADGVGDEDARARLPQRLQRRVELVGHQVHHTAMAKMDLLVVGHISAAQALQVEQRRVEGRAGIGHKFGLGRIEDLDVVLQGGQEQRGRAAHQV